MITVTMEDIKAMKDDFITPATAAKVLKMDTSRLIWYARNGQLPFQVQFSGNRVKISRASFLKAYGYADPEAPTEAQLMEKILEKLTVIEELLKVRTAS